MPDLFDCPESECWQAIFGDMVTDEQRARYERHLESCPACQERLDRAEEFGESMRTLIRRAANATAVARESTLAPVLERLREMKSPLSAVPVEAADLYFLRPADRPDILGWFGAYEVEGVIGQGGMGVVLKAFEPALHRPVAIKVLAAAVAGSATASLRFKREAQAAAAVCHEHIVAVHGVHEADGLPYLVMQYVAGESVQTRLDRDGPLEVIEIVRIGLQTAQGLAAAHAHGLIHRDIKPANLLLENGLARVRITDFGLARMADDAQLTQQGVVAGTPEYMAPEQARGEKVDHRADLFSLGSVLYALCTGVPPFRGTTALAVVRQVNDEAPTPLRALNPNVPSWLETVIARLMEKNPADRFQSAADVAGLLEGYLAHLRQPLTVPTPALPFAPNRSSTRRTGRALWQCASWRVAALFCLILVGGMAALGWRLLLPASGNDEQAKPAATDNEQQPKQEQVVVDFRKGLDHYPFLSLFGPSTDAVAKTDAVGLRFTLPAGRENTDLAGVELPQRLHGDFDIALGYELLAVGRPIPQYGAGVVIHVWFDDPADTSVILSRVQKPAGERFGAHRLVKGPDGKDIYKDNKDEKASKSRGQLRLVRTGAQLQYVVTEEGEKPRVILSLDIGTRDVQRIQVSCNSMYTPILLDVRLTELSIRADKMPGLTQLVNGQPVLVPTERAARSYWFVTAELVGLALALAAMSALGVWLYRRQGGANIGFAATATKLRAEAVAPPISFSCSTCGKSLRARAALAGKKVQCPQCGKAAPVPSIKV